MKRFCFYLLLLSLKALPGLAQDFAVRTNDIFINFKKTSPEVVKGLPLINWKSPVLESSVSPFPSFIVEAYVSSDVELKSLSMIYSNGSVVIGEKVYDVKGLKAKKVRQKLTLNDGRNVVEMITENMNGDKVSSKRSLILGNYVPDKNDGVVFTGSANKISVKRVELENDKLNLYYDLTDSVDSHTYVVSLFSSQDNFSIKQEKVSGATGMEIKPGMNYKISWNAKEVLGADFNDKVKLELRAKLYVPFVQVNPLRKSYKRGKDLVIGWKGDSTPAVLNFDLYYGDRLVYPFANIANMGETTLRIPMSVKPGKNYYFKISAANNKDQVVTTKTFNVKRKTPLLLKALPIALIGGMAATLGGGGGGGSSSHIIPDPLTPTSIH